MSVKVKYRFNEDFKAIFLDIWFEKLPESYNQAREACNQFGNEMIIWLSDTNIDLYRKIYNQTLTETKEEIIDKRLDNE